MGPPVLTGVGSFPPPATPVDEAIVSAVERQRRFGFGLVTDGEPRGDMLSLYESFPGVRSEGGIPRIVGRIRPPEDPAAFSKVRDLEFLRAKFPDVCLKASLTGPTTFAFATATTGAGPAYRGATDPALHDDLTEAIRTVAHEVGQRGAELQIDDPILSQGMRDYGSALRRVDAIASEVPRDRASLHVCGGLARGRVIDALLRLERIATLNLAFAGRRERENLSLLDRAAWEDRDILLGVGCSDVQATTPEGITRSDAVGRILQDTVSRMGPERIRYVLPDCGLRATPPALVDPLLAELQNGFTTAFTVA